MVYFIELQGMDGSACISGKFSVLANENTVHKTMRLKRAQWEVGWIQNTQNVT